ncbi:H-X9-DG-CTERM domain-containing protein [Singulisphaera sp. PoT]|uniref:H-X9-DG-CTERM domain-containing protein n=1 Tax=Singulisphaera sp. PoT TaxID=3411797 RepID=UPI003BF5E2AA
MGRPQDFLDQSAPINARYRPTSSTPWQSCQVIGKLGCDYGHEFASYHTGGFHFLFLDGSIRYLKESINPRILRCSSRARGEIIDGSVSGN